MEATLLSEKRFGLEASLSGSPRLQRRCALLRVNKLGVGKGCVLLDIIRKVRYIFVERDTRGAIVPISLRIPPKKEELIKKAAKKAGKTKTAFILAAVDEKLQLAENREKVIRKTAGWLSAKEASALKDETKIFEEVDEADWQ